MRRLIAALAVTLATPAASYVSDNGMSVRGAADGSIYVATRGARPATAPRSFFCAAGDYARRTLGAGPTAELVLAGRIARDAAFGNRRTARFVVRPRGQGGYGTGLIVRGRPGESMSVAHARQLCQAERLLRD